MIIWSTFYNSRHVRHNWIYQMFVALSYSKSPNDGNRYNFNFRWRWLPRTAIKLRCIKRAQTIQYTKLVLRSNLRCHFYPWPIRSVGYCRALRRPCVRPSVFPIDDVDPWLISLDPVAQWHWNFGTTFVTTPQPTIYIWSCSYNAQLFTIVRIWTLLIIVFLSVFSRILWYFRCLTFLYVFVPQYWIDIGQHLECLTQLNRNLQTFGPAEWRIH